MPADGKRKYCICRTTDAKSFMIGCDKCEEWFHGKCIKITPERAAHIKRYFCDACRTKDPELRIRYKKRKDKDKKKDREKRSKDDEGPKPKKVREVELDTPDKPDKPSPPSPPVKKKPPPPRPKTPKPPKPVAVKKPRKAYTRRLPIGEKFDPVNVQPVQCYGPKCVRAARANSKYCSDECGTKLAAHRLAEILPRRIEQWQNTPCVAEVKDKKRLEEIHEKLLEAKGHLEELDEKHKKLDKIVAQAATLTVRDSDSESDEEDELELFVYCVTCGHETNQRNAFKHMEKCFIKAERDMSFAGSFKSMIGGDTICDHYNAASKSYCKRLKVICPEHAKDPKMTDEDVCGCPLIQDLYTDSDKQPELCREPKKYCNKHFRWERMKRAEIDADKVRQWVKIDELVCEERVIRGAMANRASVLGLLLHQTVDHEALAKQSHQTPSKPEVKPVKPEPKEMTPTRTAETTATLDLTVLGPPKPSSKPVVISSVPSLRPDVEPVKLTYTEVKTDPKYGQIIVSKDFKPSEPTILTVVPKGAVPAKSTGQTETRSVLNNTEQLRRLISQAPTAHKPKLVIQPAPPQPMVITVPGTSSSTNMQIPTTHPPRIMPKPAAGAIGSFSEHDYSSRGSRPPSTDHDYS